MSKFGIDISTWQDDFNYSLATSKGVTFAILRAGFSTTKDNRFEKHYEQNMDRLSFILQLFHKIFKRNVFMLDNSIYRDYEYQYPFLKDLYNEFIKLKYSSKVPDVPYLHYVLKE